MRRPFSRGGAAPRRHPEAPAPDERIWGRHYTGPAPWIFGAVVVLLIAIGVYLAFAKKLPWSSEGYELTATFESASTLRETAPVRIAGVTVGKVTKVERDGDAAQVTFSVDEEGQPIHSDAEIEIRPRLFLEGNFFLDLSPGSPGAAELSDGDSIPITQTATAVQLDEVLTALQDPERRGLQRLLEGFGTGLTYQPTAADDADQDAIVRGESAARSLNDAFRYGARAGRGTAIVNTALLGEQPHDLSAFIRSMGITFEKLADSEQQLSDLITNFNVFAGALADESESLSATLEELAPTLEETEVSLKNLNDALPAVRALAIESRPGIQELPQTISAADPWLAQTRKLLRGSELGGLANELKVAAPNLAEATVAAQDLFPEQTLLGKCTSQVLIPSGDIVVQDQFSTGLTNYNEFLSSAVNLAGASQGFDGNGPYARVQTGGGPTLVMGNNPLGNFQNTRNFGNVIEQPDGIQPVQPDNAPPFRMDYPCHKNALPDVNGPNSAVGASDLQEVTP